MAQGYAMARHRLALVSIVSRRFIEYYQSKNDFCPYRLYTYAQA